MNEIICKLQMEINELRTIVRLIEKFEERIKGLKEKELEELFKLVEKKDIKEIRNLLSRSDRLDEKKRSELVDLANSYGLIGISKLTKGEIINEIRRHQERINGSRNSGILHQSI